MFFSESKKVMLENIKGEPKPNRTCSLLALDDSMRSLRSLRSFMQVSQVISLRSCIIPDI